MITYRITSCLAFGDHIMLVKTAFPSWDGEFVSADQYEIIVKFPTPQTPVDLGPLVKVEVVQPEI